MARWPLLFIPFVDGSLGAMALFINPMLGRRALLKFLKTLIFLEKIGLIAVGLPIYQAYLGIADSSFSA